MSRERFMKRLLFKNSEYNYQLPSRHEAAGFIQHLMAMLFPLCKDCKSLQSIGHLESNFAELEDRLLSLLKPLENQLERPIPSIVGKFFDELELVYEMLLIDAYAINDNDPASVGIEEVIGIYPGFLAIATYRVAHLLDDLDVPLVPRMLSEYAHSATGIEIHPKAQIGTAFFIDHGTGIVIGETTQIGNNVKIYQGVTLGATFVTKHLASVKRHPTIEDNVVIYANATILGGKTVIGHDSVIGGNAWITKSVPPHSQVFHKSEIEVKPQPI